MEYKQSTIDEIIESEKLMVLDAVERYPAHYPYALEAVLFLSNCVKSINKDRWVFGMLNDGKAYSRSIKLKGGGHGEMRAMRQ